MDANGAHRHHAAVSGRPRGRPTAAGSPATTSTTGSTWWTWPPGAPRTSSSTPARATTPRATPRDRREGPLAYLGDATVSLYTPGARPATRSLGFDSDGGLEWSPDGRLLAYGAGGSISPGVRHDDPPPAAADPEGVGAGVLADGGRIAFVRRVTRTNPEIFVARSDGSEERRITDNPGADDDPSWQPL